MRQMLKFLTLLLLVCTSTQSIGQTGLQISSRHWNGIYFDGGIRQMHFLNNNYNSNVGEGIIKVGLGWQLGLKCILNPIEIHASYYSQRYEVEKIAQRSDDLKPINLSGIETTIFYSLIPDSRSIVPLIGVGYHFGTLALEEDDAIQGVGSEVNVSSPHLAAKLRIHFGLYFEIFYRRSFASSQTESDIYSYGLSLIIPFTSFKSK